MHRRPLRQLLTAYRAAHPGEAAVADRFLAFVDAHDDCLLRSCVPGHITASAWILSAGGQRCLLTHHRKLRRWLQLGGHVDGEPEVWRAALREAQEESGMERFEVRAEPLDLDIHTIPAHGTDPEHLHLDVRFLLRAGPGQALRCSDESLELGWFRLDELPGLATDESVLRLGRKALRLCSPGRMDDNPPGCSIGS